MIFSQGDIVHFDYNPTKGHEPQGNRPSVVVSNDTFNVRTSMHIVCPITRTDNGFPLHLQVSTPDDVIGYVCTEQMRVVDLDTRRATKIGTVDLETLDAILTRVRLFF